MYQWMIISALGLFASLAMATPTQLPIILPQFELTQVDTFGLDWKVGDQASYNVDLGIAKGTMIISVREETTKGFWVFQDIDLGMLGKQKIEILHDKNTGEVLKLIVNGQEQSPPKPGNTQVEEQKEADVTVPAGTFPCVYLRIRDLDKNETSEIWVNPAEVPVYGMIKSVSPSQFGKVTIELTAPRR